MPAGGEQLAAGEYTCTYGGISLGIFEGDAGVPTLEHMTKSEPVGNTSAYGKMVIDEIYQGADWFLSMTCIEWDDGPKTALWPYDAVLGHAGVIGRLLFDLSDAIVMTAIAGTPAASLGPATVTASNAIILPGYVPRILFGPTLRKVPLRFRLFPYLVSGSLVGHFTMT